MFLPSLVEFFGAPPENPPETVAALRCRQQETRLGFSQFACPFFEPSSRVALRTPGSHRLAATLKAQRLRHPKRPGSKAHPRQRSFRLSDRSCHLPFQERWTTGHANDECSGLWSERAELQRQETLYVKQQHGLLDLRLADHVDDETFGRKQTEIRDRLARIKLQIDVLDRSHDEMADLAAKVFELSQTLCEKWLTADYATKRRILEIVFLNCRLDGATLVPTMRKPFDALAEGPILNNSRGDWI